MANSMENFYKITNSTKDKLKDIDSKIGSTGDFKELFGIDAILKRLINLFLIAKGTYILDPELGSNLFKFIFEPADIITKQSIEQEINQILGEHINSSELKVTYDILFFKNKKGFRIDFGIDYKGQKKSASINIDESLLKTVN